MRCLLVLAVGIFHAHTAYAESKEAVRETLSLKDDFASQFDGDGRQEGRKGRDDNLKAITASGR